MKRLLPLGGLCAAALAVLIGAGVAVRATRSNNQPSGGASTAPATAPAMSSTMPAVGAPPLSASPLGSSPLGNLPLGATPLGPQPLGAPPMGSSPPALGVLGSGMTPAPGASSVGSDLPLPQDYPSAKRQIEATVAAHPKEFGRRMAAAAFYMNANDHRAAVPHLLVATQLTNRVFPWIALGDAATLSGQFALAHRAYDRATKIDAGNAFTVRGRAQLMIAEQKYSEAEKLLLKWHKRYPNNNHIRNELGTLYLLQSKARKAIQILEPAVRDHPELAYQHALLGDAYARERQVERGITEMKEAVRLDPTIADAWGKLGLYQVNLSRYQEAREPLERAIALDPSESQFYAALGDSYLLEKQDEQHFTKGTQLYRQAIQLDPRNEKALYAYGMALMRRGRREDLPEAMTLFKRLLQINPNDMNAHYKLYEAYQSLGKTQEAQAHRAKFLVLFDKGRKQTRDSYQEMSFRDTPEVHLKLGREAMARKEYELAAREYQFALQRNRMLTEARQGLLEAQKRLGRTAAAEAPTP